MRAVVRAPARLHLGFITPAAVEGRRYGSVGVAIEEPATVVLAEGAEGLSVEGVRAGEAERFALATLRWLGLPGARLVVERAPPPHVGLGSTTQLALAVACAIAKAYGLDVDPVEAAGVLGRGSRSGAGVYAFKCGGLVVDGGRGAGTGVPPLVFRCDLPQGWLFLTAVPRGAGLSGRREAEAFEALSAKPQVAYRAAYVALMRLIPAALEGDFEAFSLALAEFQTLVGEAFSEVQGGVFAEHSLRAVEAMRALGIKGVGQSSWGPAVYGLVKAEEAEERLEEARGALPDCEVFLARPSSRGATYWLAGRGSAEGGGGGLD
ncbi:MAG: hypothetical protein QXT74_02995 [Candidatus Nezhaarchaeales archaeon]